MRKLSTALLVLAAIAVPVLLAVGVHFAAGSSLTAPPQVVARVSTQPIATPSVPLDVSGPCDEAERRNDPRCGVTTTSTTAGSTTTVDDDSDRHSGSDNSGSGSSSDSGRGRGRGRPGGDD